MCKFKLVCFILFGMLCFIEGHNIKISTEFINGKLIFKWTNVSTIRNDIIITKDSQSSEWILVYDDQYTVEDVMQYKSVSIKVREYNTSIFTEGYVDYDKIYNVNTVESKEGESKNISWAIQNFPRSGHYFIFHAYIGQPMKIIDAAQPVSSNLEKYLYHREPYDSGNILFVVRNITVKDAGYYGGSDAQTDAFSGERGVILIVSGKPLKPIIRANLQITAKNDTILKCESRSTSAPHYYEKFPPLSYSWFVNNTKLDKEVGETYRFNVSVDAKYNRYSCQAKESLESDKSQEIQINPFFNTIKSEEGESRNISWTATYFPRTGLYFIFHVYNDSVSEIIKIDNAILPSTEKYVFHTRPYNSTNILFEVRNITVEDAGYYVGNPTKENAWSGESGVVLTVSAMDHAGLGPYQVSNFLTALNSPSIHPSTLRARENEIGATLRNYSNESCDEALLEEANLTSKSREDPDDEDDTSPINISFDAAWQKRGSGRSYNSHSATATMIGVETGKIVAFDHKTTDCRKCLFTQTHDHECNKNFNGSSKAMESALAIDMAKSLKDRGFNISKITMDDDSTTISRMKKTVDPNIRKLSDKNHVRKNISNALYKLQEKHKSLSTKTINYLLKDVSYAISQNKGNPEGLQSSIRAIVPHSFGDHSHCDSHWCGYLKDPSNYKHSSLPYGKDLLGDNLKRDSVSQKYISQVHNRHGLSPGKFTIRHNEKMDKKRKAEKNREQTKKAKRRRLMRKSVQIKSTKSKEIREGVQYSPSVDLIVTDIDSIQTIPDKMEPPTQTCIDFESAKNADVVVFDLETTGFGKPVQPIIRGDRNVSLRYPTYLKCESRSTSAPEYYMKFPSLSYSWFVNGTTKLEHEISEIYRFNVSKDVKYNRYSCQAKETLQSVRSKEIRIYPLYGPEIVKITPLRPTDDGGRLKIKEGDTFGPYNCSADCNPPCTLQWKYKNTSGHFVDAPRSDFSSTTLLEQKANRSKMTQIQCIAKNSEGRNEQNIVLNILYILKPKILLNGSSDNRLNITEGEYLHISCYVDGNPIPTINLTRSLHDKILGAKNKHWRNHTILNTNCSDTDTYTCTGKSSQLGNVSTEFTLNVHCTVSMSSQLQIPEYQYPQKIHANRFVNGTCEPRLDTTVSLKTKYGSMSGQDVKVLVAMPVLANPSPSQARISWGGPGHPNITTTIVQRDRFIYKHWINSTIPIPDQKSFGNYSLMFHGKTIVNITINAEDRPQSPLNFQWSSFDTGFINMTWVSNFNGGPEQSFILSRKEGSEWIKVSNLTDPGEGSMVYYEIGPLNPGQEYRYQLESCNRINCSLSPETVKVIVPALPITSSPPKDNTIMIVIGASVAGIILVLILLAVVITKYFLKKKAATKKQDSDDKPIPEPDDSQPDVVVYAAVDKSLLSKNRKQTEIVESDVIKDKNDDNETVYSEVIKKSNKQSDRKTGKKSRKKKEWQGKQEDAGASNRNEDTRTVNQDGLLYIDVEFANMTAKSDTKEKPVIHGEEERTEYTFVDFSQKAPPIQETQDDTK